MAGLSRRGQARSQGYYWPGFVDAMAQLLLVIIFLLSVFMIAQFLLAREITGQDTILSRLRSQVSELTALLALEQSAKAELEVAFATLDGELSAARDDNEQLRSRLQGFALSGQTMDAALSSTKDALDAERKISRRALARVDLLNQQLSALRRQVAALNEVLEASEARDKESKTQIADLGRRLNAALAQKVQELARYRSEFFGRLRHILSQREGIRIVGDRFVFQSEVLFPKGAATINLQGLSELAALAGELKSLAREIPSDINWVLRVDGHTDSDPIRSARFRSNWELSAARAIAVVERLVADGIPANRLVAAGFGEFQPIDDSDTEEAKARNRRIELKLTER